MSAVADAPSVTVTNASGAEDAAIPLNIATALTDTDGSESITNVTIAGVPNGASLSSGTNNGDGTWTLTPAQLNGLSITPAANSDADFNLTVTATSTEGAGGSAASTTTLSVTVNAVADAPTVTVANVTGNEDTAIPLNIAAALTDTDGSESITGITISGVPNGASLSAGTNNGNGTWTLTPAQLSGLSITPPANSDADFSLSVTATSTEAAGGSASKSASFTVTVNAVADAPVVTVAPVVGNEDTAIALNVGVALADTDGSESISSITIAGVPNGASLSAGTNNGNGTWTLTPAQLSGLSITPPANSDADFNLTVRATSTEVAGGAATTIATLAVTVNAVADTPTVTVTNATGNEDTAIPLNIAAAVTDLDGSESISGITIAGVPNGATLSAGTNNGNGTWTLTPAQLSGLSITPATNSDADFSLSVTATSTETAGGSTTKSASFTVTVNAVADAPVVTVAPAVGNEDTAIALNIGAALTDTDGSESISSITISGVPNGASLSAGTNNGNGTWTLTPAQLSGLAITPPANSDVDFNLTVKATSTEGAGGAATTTATLAVTVNPVADGPNITVANVTGNEDARIPLNISAALADTDGSESITGITISGVPNGAVLSAGTNNGNGTWTLTPAQLNGLGITPRANSDADFSLTVNATSTEAGGGSTTKTASFNVTVNAVADAPVVTVTPSAGNEDTAIPLNIGVALSDTDGSESISKITISGLPSGATLSAGTNSGGTWTLTPAQLNGLTITPAANSDADFTLTVKATATEAIGGSISTTTTLAVTVNAVADTPTVTVANVTGNEDTPISLNIASALADNDGSETLSIQISGVPNGATLSAGTHNADGTWTLTKAQLTGLQLTPAANSDADFSLSVTATATEAAGGSATKTSSFTVTVNAVADAPVVTVAPATGNEDTAIPLNIAAALSDTDGSESITGIVISGMPTGATLSAGTNNGNGTWTLTPAQLNGLAITPAANSDADFSLTVKATSTEGTGGSSITTTATLNVTVNAVADAPTVTVTAATGNEDTAISLNIAAALADTDGSESLGIQISGVPAGATLSAGTDNGNGTWTLTSGQLNGLKITPPANSDADFNLTVKATSTEATGGSTTTTTQTLAVTVTAVADTPTVTVQNATGNEDTAISLNLAAALTDTDGSETLSITLSGVPTGATLSAGTNNGNGTWTLTPAQLNGLALTPAANSDADFTLTMKATSTEAVGGATATTTSTFNVTVNAVADAPTVTVAPATGNEDTAIALNITAALADTDGSETLSNVTISGVPSGATLSAGTNNGNGTWTLTPAQLNGLSITPPANSDADFSLTVKATSSEGSGGSTATTTQTLSVTVNAVADAPTVTVQNITGNEDTAISLNISAALADTDGSESITGILISGVPNGAALSAGTNNGNGTWTLTPAQLNGLSITPPANSDADFSLTVKATSTESVGGSTTTTTSSFNVTVNAVADAPTVTVTPATGNEDSAIALNIGAALADTDGSESITGIVISGVPSGAALSAGTNNGNGTWTLTPAQLNGLTITPPANSDADFSLTVKATSTEATGGSASTTTATLSVTVNAVADTPTVTVTAATGNEDSAIPLNIAAALTDTDGSESLSITISGVPNGAALSAGTNNGNGTWTLTPAQLTGLAITPAANSDADFSLTVRATSTETTGGATATTTQTLSVTVSAVADAPVVTVQAATGNEDTAISLNVGAALSDTDGSESITGITISGVPNGATLSAGTNNGNGTWTLTPAQLNGLTITPPANSDADFALTVKATSTEAAGGIATTTATLNVTVTAVADAPTVTVTAATGVADTAIPLAIAAAVADTDGSESITGITISGVPNGATLSAGTNNGNGTWTLTPAQLNGLAITPPLHSDADFQLHVTATSTEQAGGSATSTVDLSVTVNPASHAPIVVTHGSTGNEDAGIPLSITAALPAGDTGTVQVTIAGVPNGATLSAGTNNGDGSWTLSPAQLTGLTITPPANSDADFSLTVTATEVQTLTHTYGTASPFPTVLEGQTINNPNGVPSAALSMPDAPHPVSLTFVSEGAGYQNSVGWYSIGADGKINAPQMVWQNASATGSGGNLTSGTTVSLGDVAGAMGVFVIGNGNGLNNFANMGPDQGHFEFRNAAGQQASVADANPKLYFVPNTGAAVAVQGSTFHTAAGGVGGLNMNPDGIQHAVSGMDGGALKIGFEDLTGGGDKDFDDLVLKINVAPVTTVIGTSEPQTVPVVVTAIADAATLTTAAATGAEDSAIALSIGAALTDLDGSETLAVTVSGVPNGAVLSAGTNNGNGSWTLTAAQLSGLTITPPANSDADFTLTVNAVSTESAGGSTATTTKTLSVTVTAVADAPIVTVQAATGNEDTPIALNIGAALRDTDGSETMSNITISGVPTGATLSAGTNNGAGVWTLTPAQLTGLTITPPANSDADFNLTVKATALEGAGGSALTTATLSVTVNAVADAPVVTVQNVTGNEDTAIRIPITAALADVDGSESITGITVSGVPNGATLSAGTNNGNGTWTLTPAQLSELRITPPANSDADFSLTVRATSTEAAGGTATTTATFNVTVTAVADAPAVTVQNVTGAEDTVIALNLTAALADTDGSESITSITLSGLPTGATLSAGTNNGGGTWTLTPAQLSGLTLTPAANSDADFTVTMRATATESVGGNTATTTSTFGVTVSSVADAPTVTVQAATGNEDSAIPLNITAALADTDGSESISSITITGLPAGATLSAGTNNNGTWTLTPAQLTGLTVTAPANSDADFALQVKATSTEAGGGTANTTATLNVYVTQVADAPTVTVANATGNVNAAIALNVTAALVDTDGSESLAVIIAGMPSGALLSAGTNNGNGTWTLTPAQLSGLTITPPLNSDADFTLTVTGTSTEGAGGSATTVRSLSVVVNPLGPTAGNDVLTGASGNDVIDGLAGNDTLYGGAGNDTLTGGTGADLLSGGDGDDTLKQGTADGSWTSSYQALNTETGETVSLTGINQSQDVFDGGAGTDTVILTTGNDALFLDDRYSVFPTGMTAGARIVGVETVDAGDGNDLVDLTSTTYTYGNVTLLGGAGNDILWSSAGDDVIDGGSGDDRIFGGAGNDRLIGGTGTNVIDGGTGSNTVDYSAMTRAVDVDLASGDAQTRYSGTNDFVDTLTNVQNAIGSSQSDQLDGSAGDNTIWGGAGEDDISGKGGNDTLYGGLGNDELDGDDGDDVLWGESGDDDLSGDGGNDTVYGGTGNDQIAGDAGDDILWGEDGDDAISGGTGNDTLYGGLGNDQMSGGDGNDILWGGDGSDSLSGGGGDDIFRGGAGNDDINGESGTDTVDFSDTTNNMTINLASGYASSASTGYDSLDSIENATGGAGNDTITGRSSSASVLAGGAGSDTISGGSSADTITGGSGADLLYGGGGADKFQYDARTEGGDHITDFSAGSDKLVFNKAAFSVHFNQTTGAVDASDFTSTTNFNEAASSGDSHAFVYDRTSGELFYHQSGGGEGYTLMATLDNNANISASDLKMQ